MSDKCPSCGKTPDEGFSCPYCGRCTNDCPNMKCQREEMGEAVAPPS